MISTNKISVLVVEDNLFQSKVYTHIVEELGHHSVEVSSVDEALRIIKLKEFGLIITDLNLTGKSGFDLLKYLRKDSDFKSVPILIVTSSNRDDELMLKGFHLGASDFIYKNSNFQVIKKKIEVFITIAQYQNEVKTVNELLALEKQKSDNLLSKILPLGSIIQLKKNGVVRPRKFKLASVLFTDFKDFTAITKQMEPSDVISKLSYFFNEFDTIIEEHGIEKIKTIGDSYMCVGGVPIRNRSNPVDAVLVALKMLEAVERQKKIDETNGDPIWEMRIGINTGELISGVIGTSKFAYDVWGDTVNIASRMESIGSPGSITISETTQELIKDYIEIGRAHV